MNAFGPQSQRCRSLPCSVPGCTRRPAEPHHVRTRGAGGSDSDCVPLCHEHHMELHGKGRHTFETKHAVDLTAYAAALANTISEGDF